MVKIPVVDESDEIIGFKERSEITPNNIYRVSALWLKNSKDEILLAQRSLSKANAPGRWGPAVAGTVEKDENYDTTIIRETEEEIGLKDIKLTKIKKYRLKEKTNFFCQVYSATIDKESSEFKIQKEEVEQVKWFSIEEIKRLLEENPRMFVKGMKFLI